MFWTLKDTRIDVSIRTLHMKLCECNNAIVSENVLLAAEGKESHREELQR